MASNVPNRKTIRQRLATLMEPDLVGAGKAAKKLFRYKPGKLSSDASTHVIVLTSAPANRSRQAQPTRAHSILHFEIWLLVLYSAEGWTEEQSEDKLDNMEKEVSDWLLDNADNHDEWDGIELGETEYDIVAAPGGNTYRQEVIPIQVKVSSD